MTTRNVWMSLTLVLLLAVPAHADSQSANRQTPLNTTADFLATVGKSPADKKEIIKERREQRRQVRLKEEERRKRLETHKRMKQQENDMMRKINAK